MVMIRLRARLPLRDLAQRFGLCVSSVSKICTAWINLMYFELKKLCQMPDWDQTVTAKQFSQFPHLRTVLDCTEIFCDRQTRRSTAITKAIPHSIIWLALVLIQLWFMFPRHGVVVRQIKG